MTTIGAPLSAADASAAKPHRSKLDAGALAFVLGGLGLHRFYLGTRNWWLYAVWLIVGMIAYAAWGSRENTWILVLALTPVWAGFAESMAFCVMPDDRWDARHNVGSMQQSRTGWSCVMLAIAVLLLGTTAMLTAIVVASQFYYEGQDISVDRGTD